MLQPYSGRSSRVWGVRWSQQDRRQLSTLVRPKWSGGPLYRSASSLRAPAALRDGTPDGAFPGAAFRLTTLELHADWRSGIERMQRGLARGEWRPAVARIAIERQLYRLGELYLMEGIGREAYVGRRRALEATLSGGAPPPTYSEAVVAPAAQLLSDRGAASRG